MLLNHIQSPSSDPIRINVADDAVFDYHYGCKGFRCTNFRYVVWSGGEYELRSEQAFRFNSSERVMLRNIDAHDNYYDSILWNNCLNCRGERLNLHHNYDDDNGGENADRMIFTRTNKGHIWTDCRFHNNSDDGVDCYTSDNMMFRRCHAYKNGRGSNGDGNDFKLGIAKGLSEGHRLERCVSCDDNRTGYDWNEADTPSTLLDCVAYNNVSDGFRFWERADVLKNALPTGSEVRQRH